MKTYVMFCWIDRVGGGQNYVDSKVKYLKSQGWRVIVFAPAYIGYKKSTPWKNLAEYVNNFSEELTYSPEFWSKRRVQRTLTWMRNVIGECDDKIIIESHTDKFAQWGERLAELLNAKHFCFLLDEQLELYEAKEFLYYKYLRKEVAGIHDTSMKRLFDGYADVESNERYKLSAASYGSVVDIDESRVDAIQKYDYNIAYLGRNKQYVQNIVKGVQKFADNHKDKIVQFLIVGVISDLDILKTSTNVIVTNIGFLTPIPRKLFSKCDVIIAGAGCANMSAREGVPTIVADASTCKASGVLGYTVKDTLFSDSAGIDFDIILEQVLVENILDHMEFSIKKKVLPDIAYEKHFDFIELSSKDNEYFDFKKNPQYSFKSKLRHRILKGKILIYNKYPGAYKFYKGIKKRNDKSV